MLDRVPVLPPEFPGATESTLGVSERLALRRGYSDVLAANTALARAIADGNGQSESGLWMKLYEAVRELLERGRPFTGLHEA